MTIAGTGFDPASRVGLLAAPTRGQGIEFAALTVEADGSFRAAVAVVTMIPQCRAAIPPPDGTVVTIYASTPPLVDKAGAAPGVTLATATFTLGPTMPGLPNTGGGGMRAGGVVADPAPSWQDLGAIVLSLVALRVALGDALRHGIARC